MPNRLQKTPLVVYTPAVPAIPARPRYCYISYVYASPVGNFAAIGGGGGGYTYDALVALLSEAGYGGISTPTRVASPSRPATIPVQTCTTAVAGRDAVPARFDQSSGSGWNASARSVREVPTNGYFRCVVTRTPVATMVGLTRASMTPDYAAMPVAVVVRPTGYTVVERGISQGPEAPFPTDATIELRRLPSGRVAVAIDGVDVHQSSALLSGPGVYAGALLYSLQDAVDSPVIGVVDAPAQFSADVPALRALIGDAPITKLDTRIPRLQFAATAYEPLGRIAFVAQIPVAGLVADRPLVMVSASIPSVRLAATLGRPEASVSGASLLLPPPRLQALLLSGGTCSLDAKLPSMATLIADRDLVLLRAVAPVRLSLWVGEPYLLPGHMDGSDVAIILDQAVVDTVLVLVAMDSLEVSGEVDITFVLELVAMDSLVFSDSVTFGQLVEMLAMEQVGITSGAAAGRQALQYAVNILTGAPTTYDGFDFVGFATVGDTTYGVRPDGLYRIGGATDNGELIRALVDFGTSDFGNTSTKHVSTAYLGVRTDGQCFLRVQADTGADRLYRVRGESSVRRAALAKGVAARSWSLKLEVVDASFAEVDSLELAVSVTNRRGFSYRTQ